MSRIERNIEPWLNEQLASGRYGYSLEEIKKAFPESSDIAIKFALIRQAQKGKILSVHKGYYIIIPPEYATKGILPPALFLDGLMKSLKRPYYVALLSAAALHGAAHQQPQEYFVITVLPVMRSTFKKGMKINYISTQNVPASLIEKIKTESGYINVSKPVLTLVDLVRFEKHIGGINRAANVINELSRMVRTDDINDDLPDHAHVTTLQRLGYILEFACQRNDIADALHAELVKRNSRLVRIPLKAGRQIQGIYPKNRWNVIENIAIDIEE
ncbi:MAG: type IV toxin-antitoxin system AbiEi family antitoxin [Bacteroidia bacterium]|nr:type IV toxin-antitoxin system AbiEi family antitoxin [Bacteroidia bacterium]